MKCSQNSTPLMGLLALVFLIGTSVSLESKENMKLSVKKCCPKGQELNSTLMCVNVTRDLENNKANNAGDARENPSHFPTNPSKIFFPDFNDTSTENDSKVEEIFSWFPFASLISSETLEEITDSESKNNLIDKGHFEYGVRPECNSDEKEFGCFRPKYSEQFYLVLYPNHDIKLYISKKSSYHDEGHFRVENRDCGFWKTGPGENKTERKDGTDLLGKPFFNIRDLRTLPLEDFCLDKGPGDSFLAEYCPCKAVPCVRKCCADSELYDETEKKCVRDTSFGFWRPQLENSNLSRNYYLLAKRYPSTCEKTFLLKLPLESNSKRICGNQQEDGSEFHFSSDGSLQAKRYELDIPVRSYCGDHVIYDSKTFLRNNLLICPTEYNSLLKSGDYGVSGRVYGSFFIIGGLALFVTVAVSLYLPELRASLLNKAIICHNASLMLGYFLWGSRYLLPKITYKVCVFMSLGMQYEVFESLFWMNAMCLDIAMGIRRGTASGETLDDKYKLLRYMIYACGAPAIITSITAAMEFAPSLPPHYLRPGFGCSYCGFNPDTNSILIYFYGPILAIILVNLILYLWMTVQLANLQKKTKNMVNCTLKTVTTKRFVIFSKLFLSVGLSWIMEIVSWVVGGHDYYWYFFVNLFRAVVIFVLIVCKKKVFQSLGRKLKGCSEEDDHISIESRKTSDVDWDLEEIKRRERILKKQITQTFRRSDESGF